MKFAFTFLLVPALALLAGSAHAQAARDLTDIGLDLYQRANAPNALARMRQDLVNAPEAYLVAADEPGTLVLLDKRRLRVPALKYNVALRLLEVQDSTGRHVWPPGSLDGFYLGRGGDARHFRSYVVRDGSTRTDFVEVLTLANDAPLVLGVQHAYHHTDAETDPILRTDIRKAYTAIGQTVLAGPGGQPLRPVELAPRGLKRLFGARAPEVDAFAQLEHLSYGDLANVVRMVEYYNQKLLKSPVPITAQ